MPTRRKSTPNSRKKPKNKMKKFFSFKKISLILFIICLISYLVYHYREDIAYYFSFKSPHAEFHSSADTKKRINQIINRHIDKRFGIDISEYQGLIDWKKVDTIKTNISIDFILIRATAGKNKVDKRFKKNYANAKKMAS